MRFVSELPANLGHAGRPAFRFERCDQIPPPRPQIAGVERLVIGQDREIAQELLKAAQPARLDCRQALAGTTPLGRDLVIEQGEACIASVSCSSRRRRKQAISIVRCGSLMRASAAALRDIICALSS